MNFIKFQLKLPISAWENYVLDEVPEFFYFFRIVSVTPEYLTFESTVSFFTYYNLFFFFLRYLKLSRLEQSYYWSGSTLIIYLNE